MRRTNKVRELVKLYGAKKWSVIASHLPGRIGKQCRERWTNHLSPEVKKLGQEKGKWHEWEDETIMKLYKEIGPKWSRIASHLPGRTDNSIKCRFMASSSFRSRSRSDNEDLSADQPFSRGPSSVTTLSVGGPLTISESAQTFSTSASGDYYLLVEKEKEKEKKKEKDKEKEKEEAMKELMEKVAQPKLSIMDSKTTLMDGLMAAPPLSSASFSPNNSAKRGPESHDLREEKRNKKFKPEEEPTASSSSASFSSPNRSTAAEEIGSNGGLMDGSVEHKHSNSS